MRERWATEGPKSPPREYKRWASLEALEADPPEGSEAAEELGFSTYTLEGETVESGPPPLSDDEIIGVLAVWGRGACYTLVALISGGFAIATFVAVPQTWFDVPLGIEACALVLASLFALVAGYNAIAAYGFFTFDPRADA